MGSLEAAGISSVKRESLLPCLSLGRLRPRSRCSRFLHLFRIDYLFVFVIAVITITLLALAMSLPGDNNDDGDSGDLMLYLRKKTGGLDFGEDVVRFGDLRIPHRFRKEAADFNHFSAHNVTLRRFSYRKPQLALVFGNLFADPQQLLVVTVAAALQELGYEIQVNCKNQTDLLGKPSGLIYCQERNHYTVTEALSFCSHAKQHYIFSEVYSLEDGPAHVIWKTLGVPVTITQFNNKGDIAVDWLNFHGVIVNSIEAKNVLSCFLQEPFKSLPLLWTHHDTALAVRLSEYNSSGRIEVLNGWKKIFNRANAIVFPNYLMPMMFSPFDSGNFVVVPGSPAPALEADSVKAFNEGEIRKQMGLGPNNFVISIVGSQFSYQGLWLEHALVLEALSTLTADFPPHDESTNLKIMILSGNSMSNYTAAVEAIAHTLGYPRGIVEHKTASGQDADAVLSVADLVIYGSFLEEEYFPEILTKAMCFGKPIISPELAMIKKYVVNEVNGLLFPKHKVKALGKIVKKLFSQGNMSPLARNIASMGKRTARNFMVSEAVEGYAALLGNVLRLPSEVAPPRSVSDLSPNIKQEWQWQLFDLVPKPTHQNMSLISNAFLDKLEEQWKQNHRESPSATSFDEAFVHSIWEEHKQMETTSFRKKREDEELKDRMDQTHGTWDEVSRNAKRAARVKNDFRERDDRELERTGQPLCIYEPFLGEGTWPFLHDSTLYRGIGLSTKGRRPGFDDIDGPSRLQLLNNPYYRDALGDSGAYFSIANRIDRIHKNPWIGFQSWRATARKGSLSKIAENALLNAIQSRKNGDTLYFWVRMDEDPRNPLQQDLWSFCDSINAGNCKTAFSEAFKRMYGLKHDLDDLPPMPVDGDTWSVMQSWVLSTRSFLEFTMFSRMFVDALDAEMYDEHHQSGRCYLSLSRDKHCYSRVLELLINVWAYHSARRIVYINPNTGVMQEQHRLQDRKGGRMWIKWFSYSTLKSMDEDLAEEFDSDHPKRRWLWPNTGEVYWHGILERERNQRNKQKEKRRQQSKDKMERMRRKNRQKVLGKFIKPPPEEEDISNSTTVGAVTTSLR